MSKRTFLYVTALFFNLAAGCPEKEVPPCSCRTIGHFTSVITCKKADNADVLRESMNNMRSIPIRTVEIFDSNLLYIPHDLFQGLSIENIFLAGTSLMSLSDTDTAFVGLENSLKTLAINECPILDGFDWSQLRNLAALRELRTIKTGLQSIDEDIKGIAGLNLTNLLLTQDKISYISDNAFSTFHYLTTLSLKYNLISSLKRSMFPNPANKLNQIILSNNKLSSLPSDFFTNMPSLISVVLADNEFLTLDKDLFAPIWRNLKKIDVTGNALRCDCRLKWLLKTKFPKNTWGKCDEPHSVHDKELKNLSELDLWC